MKTLKRVAAATLIVGLLAIPGSASAASPDVVDLGNAARFAVLGAETVTNTGPTVVTGDLGVSPGTAITGFLPDDSPGTVIGTQHSADDQADDAQLANTAAYLDAASRAPDTATNYDTVGGLTLEPGVYNATSTMGLTGTLTLDALGDPDAVWIFQVGSALTTAPTSSVVFLDGVGQACNVFWQVTSDVTIDTNTTFVGTILALNSIWVRTGASIHGRALAQVGEVTLDDNLITRGDCAAVPEPSASPSESASPSPSASPTDSPAPTLAPTAPPTAAPTDAPTLTLAPLGSANPAASAAVTAIPAAVITPAPTDAPVAIASEAPETAPTVNGPRIVIEEGPPDVTLPPTDTSPLGSTNGSAQTFGGVLVLLGGLLVLAAAVIVRRQPARR